MELRSFMIRPSHTPYSIYLWGTITLGFHLQGWDPNFTFRVWGLGLSSFLGKAALHITPRAIWGVNLHKGSLEKFLTDPVVKISL